MRATMPYNSLTMAEMLSQQGQWLPLRQWQRHLRINGNNAIATRATMPSQLWQGSLHIDDDNGVIATRAMTPAWGRLQCRHNKGNNSIADQGQQRHCYKGNNTSSTTARSPAYPQWQRNHCHESNIHNCNDSKDACTLTATTPSQWGQWCQLDDMQQGQQR